MKSCHSNKKTLFGNSQVADAFITLNVTWKDILWQGYLVVVRQFSAYNIVKVIRLLKIAQRILGGFFMIIIICFYNYHHHHMSQ